MPITVTCPSCSQVCQVEDQHAGMMVRCPKCGNIIQVARPEVATVPVPAALPPTSSPDVAPGPSGPGFMETIQQSATSFGLDPLALKLLYAGVGCLGGMILFTFFPWLSSALGSMMGINLVEGALDFLVSAGVIGFMIVVMVVLKRKDTFDISLWVAGGWSALTVLWRLFDVARAGRIAGIGLYLSLLASLGAVGTFGFIIFQRFLKKKP